MKVVTKTGLVPVKSGRTGEVFGVTPESAREGLKTGEYVLVPDDDLKDVETHDLPDGIIKPKPAGESGGGQQAESQVPQVDIPEDWESMHHLKRVALAKKLSPQAGPQQGETTVTAADRIIREELDRRSGGAVIAGGGEQGTANFTPAPDQGLANVANATGVGPVGGEAGTANVTPAVPATPPTETGAGHAPAVTTTDLAGDAGKAGSSTKQDDKTA